MQKISKGLIGEQFSEKDIEEYLHKKLHYIEPRSEFVNKVKSRIVRSPAVVLEQNVDASLYYILAFGLLTGFLLIWALRFLRK